MDFETEIAKVSWTREDASDATKTYNKMTLAQLRSSRRASIGRPISRRAARTSTSCWSPSRALSQAIAALSAKAPCACFAISSSSSRSTPMPTFCPRRSTDESFAFYGTKLNGTPENQPRWKRAVDFTTDILDRRRVEVYVAKYFPPESKAAMEKLVGNIIAAMGRRIDNLTWMAPETKVKAKAKLAAFTPRIGYPIAVARLQLHVRPRRPVRQCHAGQPVEHDFNIHKLGRPICRWEWGLTPMTVNAQANFDAGRDHLPGGHPAAAVLRSQCRPGGQLWRHRRGDRTRDEPSFRRPGLKYDLHGNLIDWWTPGDVANFKRLTRRTCEAI